MQYSHFEKKFMNLTRLSLGAMVRLLLCDLDVMDSTPRNSLSTCGGKTAYIYPLQTPLSESLVH